MSTNGNTAAGSTVVEEALDASDDQKWEKLNANYLGYFTLRNPKSGKFLTGKNSGTPNLLTIEGIASVLTISTGVHSVVTNLQGV